MVHRFWPDARSFPRLMPLHLELLMTLSSIIHPLLQWGPTRPGWKAVGGALGKQLYLRVKDLYVNNERPEVGPDDSLTRVIIEMTHKRLGATVVMQDERLLGIITDGDLRRMLMKYPNIEQVKASQIMTSNPKTIDSEALVVDALHKMRENSITQLPVVHEGRYLGIIHLHDILKEGIF